MVKIQNKMQFLNGHLVTNYLFFKLWLFICGCIVVQSSTYMASSEG